MTQTKNKKRVILIDCNPEVLEDFITEFRNSNIGDWVLDGAVSNWRRTKIGNLRRYLKYFSFPIKLFQQRRDYEVLLGWQQFYTIVFCFYCAIFHVKKHAKLIIAGNFTYKAKKGLIGKIYHCFLKKALSNGYLDYIHVPSYNYASIFSNQFNFPLERIIVCPFGVTDREPKYRGSSVPTEFKLPSEYALAIGRSNRDYDFLINSWKGISLPLVIICDTLEFDSKELPSNITIIRTISGEAQFPFIMNCRMLIIPLADGTIPSGDTVLLTAMSFSKPIIVTKPSTMSEMYVQHGYNGLSINKNQEDLINSVKTILNDRNNSLGYNARQCYENKFSMRALARNFISLAKLDQLS